MDQTPRCQTQKECNGPDPEVPDPERVQWARPRGARPKKSVVGQTPRCQTQKECSGPDPQVPHPINVTITISLPIKNPDFYIVLKESLSLCRNIFNEIIIERLI
jgi:hypothetical protein